MDTNAHAPLRMDQRPLYAQANEALRSLVQQGGYAPGDRLPSEIELSHRLGISRPTLREALHQLEEEGTIVRRHGVGTFVAEAKPVIETGLEVLESLDRVAERSGLSTSMGETSIEERAATRKEAQGLMLPPPAPVTVATRVIVADAAGATSAGKRVAYLTDVVPQELLRQAELAETGSPSFHGSVLDHFLERGWPTLSHSRTELVADAADNELAHALHIAKGAPLLRLEAQLFATDAPVVTSETRH